MAVSTLVTGKQKPTNTSEAMLIDFLDKNTVKYKDIKELNGIIPHSYNLTQKIWPAEQDVTTSRDKKAKNVMNYKKNYYNNGMQIVVGHLFNYMIDVLILKYSKTYTLKFIEDDLEMYKEYMGEYFGIQYTNTVTKTVLEYLHKDLGVMNITKNEDLLSLINTFAQLAILKKVVDECKTKGIQDKKDILIAYIELTEVYNKDFNYISTANKHFSQINILVLDVLNLVQRAQTNLLPYLDFDYVKTGVPYKTKDIGKVVPDIISNDTIIDLKVYSDNKYDRVLWKQVMGYAAILNSQRDYNFITKIALYYARHGEFVVYDLSNKLIEEMIKYNY